MVTKKRFLRRVSVLTVGAIAAVGLAACSSSDSGGGVTDKNLTIGMNSGLVKPFEGYVKDFEKTHKGWDIKVKAVPDAQPDYIQQLVTQGLSKTTPDIVFNYDTLNQTLVGNHLLYDLKPWLDQGKDGMKTSDFLPNFLGQYKVGSQITGLPVSADSGILYYNADVFKKYGVDTPKADWSMDDMYKAAQEITQKSGGTTYGLQTPVGDSTAYFTFYPVLKAYGSNVYDPSTKKFVFANAGGIEAWTELLKPYTDNFGTPYSAKLDGEKYFNSAQTAMQVASRPGVATYRASLKGTDWNVQEMPKAKGKSTTGGGSYSLSISAKSDNKEGAFKFMSWFYSTDGGMKSAEPNGVVPATKDGLENGTWKDDTNPVPSNLIPVTKYAVQNAILPDAIPDDVQPKVVPALTEALENVVLKHMSVKDAYTAAQTELNGLLK